MSTILIAAECWMNSQLSVARYTGSIRINGVEYIVAGTDLLMKEWLPVYKKLGRERTIGLIKKGTQLHVAKEMCKYRQDNQLKLDL